MPKEYTPQDWDSPYRKVKTKGKGYLYPHCGICMRRLDTAIRCTCPKGVPILYLPGKSQDKK